MNPAWIELADGGLLRTDAVLMVARTDEHDAEGEIVTIFTQSWHTVAPKVRETAEDLARRLTNQGLPLLRCTRRRYVHEAKDDPRRTVWVNLARVLWATPRASSLDGSFTSLLMDGIRSPQSIWIEVTDPPFEQVAADLRYFLEKAAARD